MKLEQNYNLSGILALAPRDSWVALNAEKTKIVGTGKDLKTAVSEALSNGASDPVLIWCPAARIPLAGL
jgi:hypothetical protein